MARYSELTDADAAEVEQSYGLSISARSAISGGMANSSFRADTSAGAVVITILDNQDDEAAQRLPRVSSHMLKHGVATFEVLSTVDGDQVARIGGKNVLVKRWLEGRTEKVIPDAYLPAVAEMLGRIHNVDPAGLDVPVGQRRLSDVHRAMLADFPNQPHASWIRRRLARLDTSFPSTDGRPRPGWTPIHGDFMGTNVVINDRDGSVSVLDWETAGFEDPMLDCGMSMLGTCVTNNALDPHRLDLFASGYARSGRAVVRDLVRPAVEYAAVIVAFHRYRRHNIRFPNPSLRDHYRPMVDLVESEFPID